MKYNIMINKKFKYIKTYKVIKKVNDNTNALSRLMLNLMNKYLVKSNQKGNP